MLAVGYADFIRPIICETLEDNNGFVLCFIIFNR